MLSAAVVIILIHSASMAIQLSGLQGEVSSLQNQNAIPQDQVVNMRQAQTVTQSTCSYQGSLLTVRRLRFQP